MEGGKRKHLQVSWFIFSPFLKEVRPVIATRVSFLTLVLSIWGKKGNKVKESVSIFS